MLLVESFDLSGLVVANQVNFLNYSILGAKLGISALWWSCFGFIDFLSLFSK